MRNAYKVLVGKPERKRQLGGLGVYGRIILEWILGKYGGKLWIGFIQLNIGASGGLL
jgi:hypothetical protein